MLDYGATLPRKRKSPKVIFLVIFWVLVAWVGWKTFFGASAPALSPVPDEPHSSFVSNLFSKTKNPEDLKKRIQEEARTWVNYSVLVADYQSPFRMEINETLIYTAASVNKLPILAALYYYTAAGEIDLDQVITLQASDILDYGTGSMRYDRPGTTYSLKTIAQLMIKKSDNTAASILTKFIGEGKIQSLMNSWGLTQTDIANNKTSNRDMNILMNRIYTGQVTDASATQEMLGFMKDTDFEDRLPAQLPDDVTIYHKIGTEVRVIHDVGIVTDGTRTYYIGVFTNEVTNDEEAVKLIAGISKLVYEFMQ